MCRQAGIDVKTQLSSLDPDERDTVVKIIKSGGGTATATAVAAPPRSAPVIPQVLTPGPVLHPSRSSRREAEPARTAPPAGIPKQAPAATAPAARAPEASPPTTKTPSAPAAAAPASAPGSRAVEPPAGQPADLG